MAPMMITTWHDAQERFDDYLDDRFEATYGDVWLGLGSGQTKITNASRVLREYDPIAYRTSFYDWADSEGIDTDDLEGEDRLP